MLVFYDYDRTLVVHDYPMWYEKSNSYIEEIISIIDENKNNKIYGNDKPLKCMQWHVDKHRKQGDKLFVLTHEIFNLRSKMKKEHISKWYGDDLKYIEVDSPEHKIDMIIAIAEHLNVNRSECVIVDDRVDTLKLAARSGIQAIHVSNVMYEFEEFLEQEAKI